MSNPKEVVTAIVLECLGDAWVEYGRHDTPSVDSDIFGGSSMIDSTALVSMILDVEDRLSEELGVAVSLLDEKAVSQQNSPFRNVSSLVAFVMAAIEGSGGV